MWRVEDNGIGRRIREDDEADASITSDFLRFYGPESVITVRNTANKRHEYYATVELQDDVSWCSYGRSEDMIVHFPYEWVVTICQDLRTINTETDDPSERIRCLDKRREIGMIRVIRFENEQTYAGMAIGYDEQTIYNSSLETNHLSYQYYRNLVNRCLHKSTCRTMASTNLSTIESSGAGASPSPISSLGQISPGVVVHGMSPRAENSPPKPCNLDNLLVQLASVGQSLASNDQQNLSGNGNQPGSEEPPRRSIDLLNADRQLQDDSNDGPVQSNLSNQESSINDSLRTDLSRLIAEEVSQSPTVNSDSTTPAPVNTNQLLSSYSVIPSGHGPVRSNSTQRGRNVGSSPYPASRNRELSRETRAVHPSPSSNIQPTPSHGQLDQGNTNAPRSSMSGSIYSPPQVGDNGNGRFMNWPRHLDVPPGDPWISEDAMPQVLSMNMCDTFDPAHVICQGVDGIWYRMFDAKVCEFRKCIHVMTSCFMQYNSVIDRVSSDPPTGETLQNVIQTKNQDIHFILKRLNAFTNNLGVICHDVMHDLIHVRGKLCQMDRDLQGNIQELKVQVSLNRHQIEAADRVVESHDESMSSNIQDFKSAVESQFQEIENAQSQIRNDFNHLQSKTEELLTGITRHVTDNHEKSQVLDLPILY